MCDLEVRAFDRLSSKGGVVGGGGGVLPKVWIWRFNEYICTTFPSISFIMVELILSQFVIL